MSPTGNVYIYIYIYIYTSVVYYADNLLSEVQWDRTWLPSGLRNCTRVLGPQSDRVLRTTELFAKCKFLSRLLSLLHFVQTFLTVFTMSHHSNSDQETWKQKPSSLVILTLPRTYRQPSETQFQSKANDYIETKLSLLQKNWQWRARVTTESKCIKERESKNWTKNYRTLQLKTACRYCVRACTTHSTC